MRPSVPTASIFCLRRTRIGTASCGCTSVTLTESCSSLCSLVRPPPALLPDDAKEITVTKALYLYGGWPGHRPYDVAPWALDLMDGLGFEVEETQDPAVFERDLTPYDLIVIG